MVMPRGGVKTLGKRPTWSDQVWEIVERVTGQTPNCIAIRWRKRSRRETMSRRCDRY
jgi:hypothetical protein